MSIQGIFASNQGIVGERAGDFASAMLQINPTGTSLMLALTSGMGKEGAQETVFHWFEDTHVSGRSAAVSGGTTTTVVVDDGSVYVPGVVLLVEDTGEVMLVSATAGNSLTVIRGLGGTAIVAITNTMHLQNIGNAHEEASGMPVAVTQQGYPRLNYTQIFRNGWAISGTAKAVKFKMGDKLAKNRRDCAMYHAEDMERAMLFGVKHIGLLNGKQFRLTDGILAQIKQYGGRVVTPASVAGGGARAGALSIADLQEFMRSIFSLNVKGQPNERIAFAGDLVVQVINRATQLDGAYQIFQGESKVGISVWTVVSPFGTIKLMTHPLMNENPLWQHQLYVLHPGGIKRRVLRETFEEGYDQNGLRINGIDADEGQITTEMGIEVDAPSVMGIMTNILTAVKSDGTSA